MDWVIHLFCVKWNEPNPSNRIRVTCKKGVFSNLTLGQLLSKEPSIDATLLPPTKRKNSAYTGGGKVGKLIFIADAYLTKPLATRSLFSRDVWMAIMVRGAVDWCWVLLSCGWLWMRHLVCGSIIEPGTDTPQLLALVWDCIPLDSVLLKSQAFIICCFCLQYFIESFEKWQR